MVGWVCVYVVCVCVCVSVCVCVCVCGGLCVYVVGCVWWGLGVCGGVNVCVCGGGVCACVCGGVGDMCGGRCPCLFLALQGVWNIEERKGKGACGSLS